jgi:FkbM family methyltransferase
MDRSSEVSSLPPTPAAVSDEELVRVAQTLACRDSDALPKVEGAGEVFERDGVRLQRMHNGLLIEEGCYYGPWMTEIIRGLRGHHEPQEEVVFHDILRRIEAGAVASPVIIELGSHWAYYAMWFLQRFAAGRAYCLEPDANYLAGGERNLALNGLTGTFLRGAIGDPGQSCRFVQESDGLAVELPQHDLASLLEVWDLKRVDLLLVDIQGAETLLLERALPLLADGRVAYLVVSTHHHSISGSALTHQRVRDLLEASGATLLAEHTVAESSSGDGLVAASFLAADVGTSIPISRVRARDSLFGELEYELEQERLRRLAVEHDVSDLSARIAELERALAAAGDRDLELDDERAARRGAEEQLATVLSSRSWRLTGPLRSLRRSRS